MITLPQSALLSGPQASLDLLSQSQLSNWSKASFGLGSALTLANAFSAKSSARKQMKALNANMEHSLAIARNRDQLEGIELNKHLDQISTKAIKNRATFQTIKGETLSGATYNALLRDLRKNELNTRQAVKSQDAQNRIQMREQLVLKYTDLERQREAIEDSVPGIAELALQIGVQAASAYFTGGGTLFM